MMGGGTGENFSLHSSLTPSLPPSFPPLLFPSLSFPRDFSFLILPFSPPPLRTPRYVDYPVPDILEMIGRANRPLVDESGKSLNELFLTRHNSPLASFYASVSLALLHARCGYSALSELQEGVLQEVPL